mgnify:FL=1
MADTIAAIATGTQVSAIGIIRLSGDETFRVIDRLFFPYSGKKMSESADRRLIFGELRDRGGELLDVCLCTISRAPHSYTGENTAELQCHGSPTVLRAALDELFALGARQAAPGEFTKRAFLNGRMELCAAEAVADIIDAETVECAKNAAGQLSGAISRKVDGIYSALTDISSHYHAVLDYPDEDIDPFTLSGYEASLTESSRQLTALLSSCRRGRMVQSGIKAVILGSPNAGKSSLLNRLSGFDRVIVTDIPGTTRDTVEQTVTLGRHLVRLVDTAGIRDTQDVIEKIGVDRSMEAAKDCDVALYVLDDSKPMTEEDRRAMGAALEAPEAVAILNKQDLAAVIEPSDLPFAYIVPISCKDGTGFDLLEQAFDMLFPDDTPCDGSLLTNARQAGAILRAKKSVDSAVQSLRAGMTPDAVLVDLESAMDALGEVTGRTMREDITNRIFERFCVGK